MYSIVKSVINSGEFELSTMLTKIKTLWVQGDITESESIELTALAQEKAKAENSYAPWQEQIAELFVEIKAIKADVDALKNNGKPSEDTDEYPEYKAPTGSHDAYNTGDKITFNGKHYECTMNGCVWSPDIYPNAWKEVK